MGVTMKNVFSRTTLATAVSMALCGILAAPAVIAQDDSDDEQLRLEEVIVTANRRDQSLQDAAIAISAISGTALEEINASSFSDYFRNIPSLSITDRGPGSNNITIRGVTVDAQEGQIPTTAIYVDESPITAQFSNTDLRVYDIERVEVLRGPQGTLYGSTALGGAVRFITKKANPNEFEGYVSARFESIAHGDTGFAVNGAVNFPLIEDTLGLRISAYSEEDAGYIDNFGSIDAYLAATNPQPVEKDIGGTETQGGRLNLFWNATDSFRATLGYVYQETDGVGQPMVETVLGLATFDANFDRTGFDPVPAAQQTPIDALATFANGDESLRDEMKMPSLNLAYSTENWGEFTYNYTDLEHSFRRGSNEDNSNPFADQNIRFVFFEDFDYDNEAHELRWVSNPEHRVRWVLGAFKEDNFTHINVRVIADDPWIQLRNPGLTDIDAVLAAAGLPENHVEFTDENFGTEQEAYYGELTVDINDQWQVTGGIRYSEWESYGEFSFGRFGDVFFVGGDLEGTAPGDVAGLDVEEYGFEDPGGAFPKNDVTIGKLNIAYQPGDDTLVFAQWSEGFRLVELGVNEIEDPACLTGGSDEIPGLNGQNLNPVQFSDDLTNIEVGVKKGFANGRVTANVGAYVIDWSNIQFEGELPNDCGGVLPNGDAEIKGLEFEVSALLSDDWRISVASAITDGEITRVPQLVREDNTLIPLNLADPTGARIGTRMPGTPRTQFSVTTDYTWLELIGGFDGNLNVNYVYTDAVNNNQNESNVPGLRGSLIKGDDISLLNLGFTLEKDSLSFDFYVNNVFDSIQSAFSTINRAETRLQYNIARPRVIGVGIRKEF